MDLTSSQWLPPQVQDTAASSTEPVAVDEPSGEASLGFGGEKPCAIKATNLQTLGFYSQLFAVPKKDGGWRPIINLKSLNAYLMTPHFKMEGIQSLKDTLVTGDFMVKLDLKDAYLSIPMSKQAYRYLRFAWVGKVFEFSSLPFGLAPAPIVFTKLLKPAAAFLRRHGIRIHIYLDDMLLMAPSASQLQRHVVIASEVLTQLGFVLNLKKCETELTQLIEFLGFTVNSESMNQKHQRC